MKKNFLGCQNKNAFTVVEVILAMTVLFVGILGIFSLFPAALKMAEVSKITTRMTIVGQSKLEELTAIGFDNLVPGTYTPLTLNHIVTDATIAARFQNSRVIIENTSGHDSVNEAKNPLNNNPLLLKVTADIRYDLGGGREKAERFITYLSNLSF